MKLKRALTTCGSCRAIAMGMLVMPVPSLAQTAAAPDPVQAAPTAGAANAPSNDPAGTSAPTTPTQAQPSPNAAQTETGPIAGEAQDIIVTGSARTQRRFDVSYAVNALSQNDVKKLAPLSFADLLGKLPGIQVENTSGDVGGITRVRGIPTDDGSLLYQQDGLPLFHDILGFPFKGDALNRYDLMTDRLEVVRGGPAPIFGSEAAAIANSVTVTGTDVTRGKVQFTAGTTDLFRLDAVQSGPLGDRTFYAIGGFIRRDGGQRDNGFPQDRGGQIRANVKHDFDNGSIRLSGLYLNDHNVFYLPIPIADPRNPSVSLDPYIDYFHGTLNTPALRNVNIKYLDGAGVLQGLNRDLSNGRHTKVSNVGLQYDGEFGDWLVSAKGGYTRGRITFDAFYSTTAPAAGAAFAAPFLSAAQTAFAGTTRLGYAIAGTNGTQVYDPNSDSGLVVQGQYRAITNDFYSGQGDFSVTRKLETGIGEHDVKVGLYGSSWGEQLDQAYNDYLVQVRGQPQLLDLVAYNAAGGVTGYVTDKGVLRYATTLVGGKVDATVYSFYANDTWTLNPSLRVDAGIRHENYNYHGYSQLTAGNTNLGDSTTLADNATVRFTGATQLNDRHYTLTNWTVGINGDASRHFGGYLRASHLESPPPAYLNAQVNQVYVVTKADQYEAGAKLSFGRSYLYLTGFYTKFKPLNSTFVPFNPVTGQTSASIPFVSDLDIKGIEADGALNPVRWFSLSGSVTVQDPVYKNLQPSVANGLSPAAVEGRQVIREPKVFGNVRPSFNFDLGAAKVDVYARYEYVGRRYVDFLNITELPAYDSVSAGVTATFGTFQVQVVGDNIFDSKGLTEGNNRVDQLSGQGTRTAIYGRPVFGRSGRIILSKSW